MSIQIYTDGSSGQRKGENGGWAFVALEDGREVFRNSGGVKATSNNRMELQATIEALAWIKRTNKSNVPVTILSDSMYVIDGITKWIYGWLKKKNLDDTYSVVNDDLWMQLHALRNNISTISFKHVPAHSGVHYNEICDKMAKKAKQNVTNQSHIAAKIQASQPAQVKKERKKREKKAKSPNKEEEVIKVLKMITYKLFLSEQEFDFLCEVLSKVQLESNNNSIATSLLQKFKDQLSPKKACNGCDSQSATLTTCPATQVILPLCSSCYEKRKKLNS